MQSLNQKYKAKTDYTKVLCIPHQLLSRPHNDISRLLDLFLRESPVPGFDGVADGGEVGLVVGGPELGAEEDVFELCAVGDLSHFVSLANEGGKG
jgi:hypothetical protein